MKCLSKCIKLYFSRKLKKFYASPVNLGTAGLPLTQGFFLVGLIDKDEEKTTFGCLVCLAITDGSCQPTCYPGPGLEKSLNPTAEKSSSNPIPVEPPTPTRYILKFIMTFYGLEVDE